MTEAEENQWTTVSERTTENEAQLFACMHDDDDDNNNNNNNNNT